MTRQNSTMLHVALLRGINVGKSNRIKMADLIGTLQAFRIEGATTYLQSGNVLFDWHGSANEARTLFDLALVELGLRSTANLRSSEQMQAVAAKDAFNGRAEPAKAEFVTFLDEPYEGVLQAGEASEILLRTPTEVYWVATPREGKAPTGPKLPKGYETQSTTRNWIVTRALADLLRER
jgi:uncharacterized protein (DUF1697 family)